MSFLPSWQRKQHRVRKADRWLKDGLLELKLCVQKEQLEELRGVDVLEARVKCSSVQKEQCHLAEWH